MFALYESAILHRRNGASPFCIKTGSQFHSQQKNRTLRTDIDAKLKQQ
ncbi:hypothetical protein SynA1825c_01472 [Synechococcus sp. A18-25c]|nr:hypothetical protein SynA1825c_01472 [Synechococcus sp. A18-25c]